MRCIKPKSHTAPNNMIEKASTRSIIKVGATITWYLAQTSYKIDHFKECRLKNILTLMSPTLATIPGAKTMSNQPVCLVADNIWVKEVQVGTESSPCLIKLKGTWSSLCAASPSWATPRFLKCRHSILLKPRKRASRSSTWVLSWAWWQDFK